MPFYDNTNLAATTDERLLSKEIGNLLTITYFRRIARAEVLANTTVQLHRQMSIPFNKRRYSIVDFQYKSNTLYSVTGVAGAVSLFSDSVFIRPEECISLIMGTTQENFNATVGSAPDAFIAQNEIPIQMGSDFTMSPLLQYRDSREHKSSFPSVITTKFQQNFFTIGYSYYNCPSDDVDFEALLLSNGVTMAPAITAITRSFVDLQLLIQIGLYD